nr:MAG TPA: hypothetical protein [Crassvirales sp.]
MLSPQLSCETTVGDYFCPYSTKTNFLKIRFKRAKFQSGLIYHLNILSDIELKRSWSTAMFVHEEACCQQMDLTIK